MTVMLPVQVCEMAAQHERQTFELQRQHTTAIDDLMEETNRKLSKMQADYDELLQSTVTAPSSLSLSICSAQHHHQLSSSQGIDCSLTHKVVPQRATGPVVDCWLTASFI